MVCMACSDSSPAPLAASASPSNAFSASTNSSLNLAASASASSALLFILANSACRRASSSLAVASPSSARLSRSLASWSSAAIICSSFITLFVSSSAARTSPTTLPNPTAIPDRAAPVAPALAREASHSFLPSSSSCLTRASSLCRRCPASPSPRISPSISPAHCRKKLIGPDMSSFTAWIWRASSLPMLLTAALSASLSFSEAPTRWCSASTSAVRAATRSSSDRSFVLSASEFDRSPASSSSIFLRTSSSFRTSSISPSRRACRPWLRSSSSMRCDSSCWRRRRSCWISAAPAALLLERRREWSFPSARSSSSRDPLERQPGWALGIGERWALTGEAWPLAGGESEASRRSSSRLDSVCCCCFTTASAIPCSVCAADASSHAAATSVYMASAIARTVSSRWAAASTFFFSFSSISFHFSASASRFCSASLLFSSATRALSLALSRSTVIARLRWCSIFASSSTSARAARSSSMSRIATATCLLSCWHAPSSCAICLPSARRSSLASSSFFFDSASRAWSCATSSSITSSLRPASSLRCCSARSSSWPFSTSSNAFFSACSSRWISS
mmetsp:Transcript_23410/g.55871  ORF Transcript_23410/g.55871 Transcript_23410/m.55871 type:complete len:568 (-) Transcript_23410:2511-4214(-)